MCKRVFIICFIGILIVVAGIIGIIVSDNSHKIPYYNSSTNHIILSDKINKLSGNQQRRTKTRTLIGAILMMTVCMLKN